MDDELERWRQDARKRERVATIGMGVLLAFVIVVLVAFNVVASAVGWHLNQQAWHWISD